MRYLIKGRECVGNNWRNVSVTYDAPDLDKALARFRGKYWNSDKLIIESAFIQVMGRTDGKVWRNETLG